MKAASTRVGRHRTTDGLDDMTMRAVKKKVSVVRTNGSVNFDCGGGDGSDGDGRKRLVVDPVNIAGHFNNPIPTTPQRFSNTPVALDTSQPAEPSLDPRRRVQSIGASHIYTLSRG